MSNLFKLAFALIPLGGFFFSGCGPGGDSLAGSGSETTTEVKGKIVTSQGVDAEHAIVKLLHVDHAPQNDPVLGIVNNPVDEILTDSSGIFSFDSVAAGLFNVEAEEPLTGHKVLIDSIELLSGTDLHLLEPCTLKEPGAVIGSIPKGFTPAQITLAYVPGTTSFSEVLDSIFWIKNIPAGVHQIKFADWRISEPDTTSQEPNVNSVSLIQPIKINPNDTLQIGADQYQ